MNRELTHPKIILLPAQQKIKSISYIPNSSGFRVFRFRTLGKGRIPDFDPRVKRKGGHIPNMILRRNVW